MVYTKSDWLKLGLKLLVSDSAAAIRIDRLCKEVGRTKGSFYHHFKDRDAYVFDLAAYWEHMLIAQVNEKLEPIGEPNKKIAMLKALASGAYANEEQALRRWAGTEPIIAKAIARIDKRRVDYLARLWQDAKDITSQQAIDLAVMDYAAMVGFQQLYVPVTNERRTRIDAYYGQVLQNLPDRT